MIATDLGTCSKCGETIRPVELFAGFVYDTTCACDEVKRDDNNR